VTDINSICSKLRQLLAAASDAVNPTDKVERDLLYYVHNNLPALLDEVERLKANFDHLNRVTSEDVLDRIERTKALEKENADLSSRCEALLQRLAAVEAELERVTSYWQPGQIELAKHEAEALWLTLGDAESFAREAKAAIRERDEARALAERQGKAIESYQLYASAVDDIRNDMGVIDWTAANVFLHQANRILAGGED
jgi:DNA-binding FrmR family transcriptional regulator